MTPLDAITRKAKPPRGAIVRLLYRFLVGLAALPLIAFLLLPIAGLLFHAQMAALVSAVVDPQAARAISLSAQTTLLTVVLTVLLGTPVAYVLARKEFAGKGLLDALIELPIVLPPSVAGIALLLTFGRRGILGSLLSAHGVEIPFTESAVVMAQLFVASPLYVKTLAVGFAEVDRQLEQAASIDGASAWQTFRFVTLPLSARAALGGAIMSWARSLGEFGATIIFAGNFPGRTQTMPLAIYIGFEMDLQTALALGAILLVVSFLVLAAVKVLLGKLLVLG
ncbi:MAG TPA: ABC transporter permease [Bacteroidota bacterium]|nr:ABC transporter permease [Bacteroidota bacterium]